MLRWLVPVAALLAPAASCNRRSGGSVASEARPATAGEAGAASVDAAATVATGEADAAGEPEADEAEAIVARGCPAGSVARIPTEPDPMPEGLSADRVDSAAGEGTGPIVVRIETTAATLECTLDAQGAPATVANFVGLATGRRPWWDPCRGAWVREPMFDGMAFHKLVPGFVAQAGCPIGDGTAGPGYAIADEPRAAARHDGAGVLSMANVGPGTAGSQFFVTLGPAPQLDRTHTPFGRCGPQDAVRALDAAAREGSAVRIRRVTLGRRAGS